MSQPLPRYTDTSAADHAKITRILIEVGEPDPRVTSRTKTFADHTDYARLRGLPAIGRNVTGAIPGTRPEDCLR